MEETEFTIIFYRDPNLNRAEARLLKKVYMEFARELEREFKKIVPDVEVTLSD